MCCPSPESFFLSLSSNIVAAPHVKQVIPITIPRMFYVNCLEDKGPAGSSTMGRRVARTLPNGRASPFLYEVAMDEAKFQRNEKQVQCRG